MESKDNLATVDYEVLYQRAELTLGYLDPLKKQVNYNE